MNPQPKLKRIECKAYLHWLRNRACVICGEYKTTFEDVVPSHQTIKIPSSVKGTAQKSHDIHALPVHSTEHTELEHQYGLKIEGRVKKILIHIFAFLVYKGKSDFAYNLWKYEKELEKAGDEHAQEKTLEWVTREWPSRF